MKKISTSLAVLSTFFSINAQNFEWAKSMGGTNTDVGKSVAVDAEGIIYTTGVFQGSVDFDPGIDTFLLTSFGSRDIFITKFDASGNFIWAKQMGGTGNDMASSITLDSAGNIYTTGRFTGTGDFDPGNGIFSLSAGTGFSIFISKLDSLGNFVWAKAVGGGSTFGNFTTGHPYSSLNVNTSGIILTGFFTSTQDFDPGPNIHNLTAVGGHDIFILKITFNGDFVWVKQIGGPGSEAALSIAQDAAENIILTGLFTGNNNTVDFDPGPGMFNLTTVGTSDIFVLKLNSAGDFLWAKQFGGTDSQGLQYTIDEGRGISVDNAGNIVVVGNYKGSVDFDPGPGIHILTSNGWVDAFILKLDPAGNFIWAQSFGGSNPEDITSISIDQLDNIYVSGYYYVAFGISNIFVNKYSNSGALLWSINTSTIGGEAFSNSLFVDASGNIIATGEYYLTVDLDPTAGVFNFTSNGGGDIFILKLSQCTPPALSTTTTNSLCPGGTGSATVTASGNAPFTYSWSNGQTTQTATGLPAGTHTLTVTDDSSCAAIATVIITEPPAIVSNVTSTPTNFNSPNCNGSVTTSPAGGTPPFTILWNSATTTNLCQGWYTVTITDANNCVMTDSVYVNFVTGIEELNAAGISIYPNPVDDVLFITSEIGEIGEVKIYDIVGRTIKLIFTSENETEIDLKELKAGIYFVKLENLQIKFVKQ